MTIYGRRTGVFWAAALCAVTAAALGPARADRLVFQQGDALYAADADGQAIRRLFAVGRPNEVVWTVSPDGRRVAWLAPRGGAGDHGAASALHEKPISVWVCDLSGRRRRRLLVTSDLRDRQGRPVTRVSPAKAGGENDTFAEWGAPDSLAWSADGKSLYLSCASRTAGGRGSGGAFIVDADTGAAVVDAEGRWKSIAPVREVDARGSLLVGVGYGRSSDAGGAARERSAFSPLLVADLAEGSIRSLLPGDFTPGNRPEYADAQGPTLSPNGETVVFGARGSGLWLVDTQGRNYRRLTNTPDDRSPRWSSDGKRILFLARGLSGGRPMTVLSRVDLPSGDRRRVLLSWVDRFFLVPD